MHFKSAIGSAFRRAGDFKGRASRSEFWYFFLLNLMIQTSAAALDYTGASQVFAAGAVLWAVVALVPGLSLFIRRLRDAGYSPWMSLFALAGPIGAIVFLVLLVQPSAAGTGKNSGAAAVPADDAFLDMPWSAGPDQPDDGPKRTSALLLGIGLLATAAIVLGSLTFAATQASLLEAETEAEASRIAAANSSRAAAAVKADADRRAAAVKAEADRRAAAQAEESRVARIFQEQQEAEASRSAAASQEAAAAALDYAQARDALVAEGWSEGPDGVFYRWVAAAEVQCPQYQACVQLKVTAPDGCPDGVTVDASEMWKGTVTGSTTGYGPGFLSGQNALVTLTASGKDTDNVSIKKMTCY